MKILIENYRGWEIYFNSDSEEFYTVSNEHDTEKVKKTFASTKKFIDDYLKDNLNFKPFIVESEGSAYSRKRTIKIIGIRKDGAFMYEDDKGEKAQLSKYDEKEYFLVNDENKPIFKEIEDLEEEGKKISLKIKSAKSRLVKVGLDVMREKYSV